jgi:hypothetical protein
MTLFLLAHLAFVVGGFWAVGSRRSSTSMLALYAASQLVFIGAFGGVLPFAIAARLDQALIVVALAAWLKSRSTALATR